MSRNILDGHIDCPWSKTSPGKSNKTNGIIIRTKTLNIINAFLIILCILTNNNQGVKNTVWLVVSKLGFVQCSNSWPGLQLEKALRMLIYSIE
jgi:hypothetical protein